MDAPLDRRSDCSHRHHLVPHANAAALDRYSGNTNNGKWMTEADASQRVFGPKNRAF
jgi:hypothetical protein